MVFRNLLKPENPELSRNRPIMASSTAAKPPHHHPLHNFPLQDLKWSNAANSAASANQIHPRVRKSNSAEKKKNVAVPSGGDELAEEKAKVCVKIKSTAAAAGIATVNKSSDELTLEEEFLEAKTWNLRPRKPLPSRNEVARTDSGRNELTRTRLGSELKVLSNDEKKEKEKEEEKKKEKFSITLRKEEIEEDVFVLTGSKPARRPKKRPRHVQKLLDSVFPGLWLASITPDSYRVDPPTKG